MYKEFTHIDDLISWAKYDKEIDGSLAPIANRYPIRFVLFDNFRDSFEFVSILQNQFACLVESVNNWIEEPYCDTIITHSKLADKFEDFILNCSLKTKDYIITPFSELARFYDNDRNFEFNSLISTIKGIENTKEAFLCKRRIYVPIVGLEGKFSKFSTDNQIIKWYYKNTDKQLNYKLIITENTTYSVQGLDEKFTIVNNMQEWLITWRNKDAKQEIISLSPSIFANAEYAQPDNAFTFCICNNVYEYLTNGLNLDFGTLIYNPDDECYWLRLASEININNFSFEVFFNRYFHIDDLADYNVFLKTWFECKDNFEKWLLCNYYTQKFCQKGYICQTIKEISVFTDYDFFAVIALKIFNIENKEEYLEERNICMQYASQKQVKLTNQVQNELSEKLQTLAIEQGYTTAIRYFSPLTSAEKSLAILWLGQDFITKNHVLAFFPDLYHYLSKSTGINEPTYKWILNYTDLYKQSKVSNKYLDDVKTIIQTKNGSNITFNQWYHDFKTTKTILNNRSDIEVYYWIDGLGIDWIPFITEILSKQENVFLNEVYIARALYPTTTSINKMNLLEVSNSQLVKIGDLDSHAHKQGNKYPNYIIEEFEIVKRAIQTILNDYVGKKIAIVSDHGLTALSQFREGLNLAGLDSDHYGRVAYRSSGKTATDKTYIVLEDNKTICALNHSSLCGKVPIGQCAHGGCTPEEILVPLLIISSQPNATNYSVSLISKDISGTNPIIKCAIKGLSVSDTPYAVYDGIRYELSNQGNDIYYSERLNLSIAVNIIELYIGSLNVLRSEIHINLGADEDNLFDL